jgi:thiamine-monophosphate kinase
MSDRTADPISAATVADLGELRLIAMVTADLATDGAVLIGPGDDAAVLDLAGPVLTSVDVLVENVHFRRTWSDADHVGRKSIGVNVADIEAMGGRAVAVTVGFSAPPDLPASWVAQFGQGLRAECARAGIQLVGGDVTAARDITVSVSVLGVLDGRRAVLRSGASAGHVVAMTGRTGWAAAGLVVLGRGFRSPRAVVEAYRVPEVPYGQGAIAAAAGATAMIDVSDGLIADLGHVARASNVIIDLTTDAFDVPEPLQAVSAATGTDPYRLILTGGEDHALAAVFPTRDDVPQDWTIIGSTRDMAVDEEPQVLVDGQPWEGSAGFDHFGGRR